jgi:cytochrome P450
LSRVLDALRSKEVVIFDNFVQGSIKNRIEELRGPTASCNTTREDMFHFLCTAKDPDTGMLAFTDGEISGEAQLLLVAGSDSTTVTMCGLFFYLAHYPKVHQKLVTEIRETFSNADEITQGPRLQSCTYLRVCIDEGMRISPAGLSELPREVLPGGIKIDGEFFPAGTVVGTANWTDGRNEEVYADPEAFRPERWIPGEQTTAEEVSQLRAAFHPFSMGPFNCAGSNFALQELMLMVAKTIHRFDFRPAPGFLAESRIPHFPLIDAYITVRDGPMLQFRRRQQS